MKKIFITGGTGFFGRAFLRYFDSQNLAKKFEITLLTRNKSRFISSCPRTISLKNVEIIEGDVLNYQSLPQNNFEYIIHAATDSTNGLKIQPLERSNQITEGTKNILEWSKSQEIKNLLYVSSGGVYGTIHQPVKENCTSLSENSNIDNTYSVSKYFSEHLCFLYASAYNIPFSIIRCFSFVGEDLPRNVHFAIGNFLENALNNVDILINGDGSPIRSYMDQRDLAHWMFSILINGKNKEIYNVGSDEEVSIRKLADLIKNLSNSKNKVLIKGVTAIGQSKNRNYYVPDITKAKEDLGLTLRYNLKESIQEILSKNNKVF